jgi:hypothetical protein
VAHEILCRVDLSVFAFGFLEELSICQCGQQTTQTYVAVTGNRHRYPWPHRIWCFSCLLSLLSLPLPLERREAGEE